MIQQLVINLGNHMETSAQGQGHKPGHHLKFNIHLTHYIKQSKILA